MRMNASAHWSHYWRSGQTESCFSSGKPVDCSHVWTPFFAALRPGARVLDLACGAGSVAKRAVEAQRGFEVVGVDFASDIKPLDGVRFVLETRIEALPFPAASFDAIVSQYGFEYADTGKAAPEAARVLAPGGRMAMILHAQEGPPVQDVLGRLQRAQALLAPNGLMRKLEQWVEAAAAGKPLTDYEAAVEEARQAAFAEGSDNTTRHAVSAVMDAFIMRRWLGSAHVADSVGKMADELQQYCARLHELRDAAHSHERAKALGARFESLGLRYAEVAPVQVGTGDLAGWLVRGDAAPV